MKHLFTSLTHINITPLRNIQYLMYYNLRNLFSINYILHLLTYEINNKICYNFTNIYVYYKSVTAISQECNPIHF